jgi:hypothetical protein
MLLICPRIQILFVSCYPYFNASKLISSYKHNPFGLLADVAKCNPLTTHMSSITSILIIATL